MKGAFHDILRLKLAEQLLVSEGPSLLSLSSPLLHLNLHFLGGLAEVSSDNLSQGGQDYHASETISIFPFDTTGLHLGKTDTYMPNQLICSSKSTWGFLASSFSWRLSLFFPFWLYIPESSSASVLFATVVDSSGESTDCPSTSWKGNKFPDVWDHELCLILQLWQSSGAEDLWLLHISPTSGLQGAGWSS